MTRSYGYDAATGALSVVRAGWGAVPVVWFQDDVSVRDAVGNVVSVTDRVSSTVECFSYDGWGRLVRARTVTVSAGCAGVTGGVDVYDVSWVLDDVDRFASRVDNVAGLSRSYSYGDAGHPFAVTSVSGVGVFGYDQVGAMVSRAGGTLVYDALHRLVSYAGEGYVQSTGNRRLVVTGPAGRVLYLGGVEVTANGPSRTITRHVTIDGTVVAVTTTTTGGSTSVVWSCAHPQNSVTCHAPTSGATPGVRRYHPYGTARNSVTTPATNRGYLGQPADTTGLAYLDNRYYDPDLGVFLSVDPLVATTGTPYLYANANPTTLSDPSGLCGFSPNLRPEDAAALSACASAQSKFMQEYPPLTPSTPRSGLTPDSHDDVDLAETTPMPPLSDGPRLWKEVLLGFDEGAQGGGVMACGGFAASVGSSVSGTSCIMVDGDGVTGLITLGRGVEFGLPSASVTAGIAFSNANANDLRDWSVCGNASASWGGGVTGSLCGSVSQYDGGDWSYSGAWTFYVGVTASPVPGGRVSGGFHYAQTWLSGGDTSWWDRVTSWLLS